MLGRIRKIIDKAKKQPIEVRKKIALVAALSVTALFVVGYYGIQTGFGLETGSSSPSLSNQDNTEKVRPFRVVGDLVQSMGQDLADFTDQIGSRLAENPLFQSREERRQSDEGQKNLLRVISEQDEETNEDTPVSEENQVTEEQAATNTPSS